MDFIQFFKHIVITAFIFNILFYNSNDDDWNLVRNEENIKVYTRLTSKSDFKEVLLKTTLSTDHESLIQIIKDFDHYSDWIENCATARLVQENTDELFYYYFEMEATWPIDNRDMVLKTTLKTSDDNNLLTMNAVAVDGMVGEKEDIVRVEDMELIIKLKRIEGNRHELSYYASMDPAGRVPAWVVNLTIEDGPFNTVKNLKKKLQKN